MAPIFHFTGFLALNAGQAVGLLFLTTISFIIMQMVYNVWFHQLSKIPGPKLCAATEIFHSRSYCGGRHLHRIKELHDIYGSMVRVGPNYVSFNTPSSWKEIYGHFGSRKQFLKSSFYGVILGEPSVVTQRDPQIHAKQRRLLSNAFSAKALLEQEKIVQNYSDILIRQLGKYASGPSGANWVEWYNWATFDIIGDLGFGEPFGSLETAEGHSWVKAVFQELVASTYAAGYRNWLPRGLLNFAIPKESLKGRELNAQYALRQITKRMNTKTDRKDLVQKMLQEKDATSLTITDLVGNSSVLVIAGSETTSSFTYYLCRMPHVYKKLTDELRGTFSSYDQISHRTTEALPYLRACVNEAFRIAPPVSFGLPRDSPGETVDGVFIPEGTEVFTTPWAATHAEENFHRPYEFIPERWLDPDCTDKLDASQPFSMGNRVCLGRNLAMMELRLIITKIFWVYDVELLDNKMDWVKDSKFYTIWQRPTLRCRCTKREEVEVPERGMPK